MSYLLETSHPFATGHRQLIQLCLAANAILYNKYTCACLYTIHTIRFVSCRTLICMCLHYVVEMIDL